MNGWQIVVLVVGLVWAPVVLFGAAMWSTAQEKRASLEEARIAFWDKWLAEPPAALDSLVEKTGIGTVGTP